MTCTPRCQHLIHMVYQHEATVLSVACVYCPDQDDYYRFRVLKLSPAGVQLASFDLTLHETSAAGLAVDNDRNIYVADFFHHGVVKLSSTGAILAIFPVSNATLNPWDVKLDSARNMWVTSGNDDCSLFQLSPTGVQLAMFDLSPAGLRPACTLALDAADNM